MSIIYINPYQFAAAGPTDPYFANVSLLLHGDGCGRCSNQYGAEQVWWGKPCIRWEW